MARTWLTKASCVIGDEMDHVQVNGCTEPIRFTSKQERKRWMKEHGYVDAVRHVGEDGGDKSRHTSRWVTMDQYTLDNARELLERAAKLPTRNDPSEAPLKVRMVTGELNGPEFKEWNRGKGR